MYYINVKAKSCGAPFLMHIYSPKLLKGLGLDLVLQGADVLYDTIFI